MSFTTESAQSIFPDTQITTVVPNTIEQFNQLKAEDQLALIWFAFTQLQEPPT